MKLGEAAKNLFAERKEVLVSSARKNANKESPYELRDVERFVDRLHFEVKLENGDDSVTGDLESVLAEFDRRTATKLTFEGNYGFSLHDKEALRIELNWTERYAAAAVVTVTASDHGWANKATAILSELLDRRNQNWSWIHKLGWQLLAFLAISATAGKTTSLVTEPFLPKGWNPWIYAILPNVASMTVIVCTFFIRKNFLSLFPKVEVIDLGQTASKTRRWIFVGTLLMTIFLGILVNRIS
ncbi:hypothetical protein AB0A63_39210 [Lentzea sp. NPDC042327]|uniref:hypothetical protein n=1 Tax=Lentzea sp. NPDC042327 TaxID=3154801 RepID=UPI0033EBEC0C